MIRPFILAAVAALALAGCGSDSSSSSDTTTAAAPAAATTAAAATPAAGGLAITMKDFAFDPPATTVKVGQKITWTNQDTADHNVTATSGAKFASGDFGQGGTFSYTPTAAGTIQYVCTLHPGMEGTLTVVG